MKKFEYEHDVIIIGAGPAGISAAIWCRRLGFNIVLLEQSNKIGGQLHNIDNQIIDYPGQILQNGAQFATTFEEHMNALNIHTITGCKVQKINEQTREVKTNVGTFKSNYIITATGTAPRQLHIRGEDKLIHLGQNISTSKNTDQFKGRSVAIIGGGDRAFEGAKNIAHIAKEVFIIHRSETFTARNEYVEFALNHPNISIIANSTVSEILYDGNSVQQIVIQGDGESLLSVNTVLIRIGVVPVVDVLPKSVLRNQSNEVICDKYGQTSIPWLFAIGDVVTPSIYSSISLSVGQGMQAAKTIARGVM
jgi:thioredoxin reductase (NADPH)